MVFLLKRKSYKTQNNRKFNTQKIVENSIQIFTTLVGIPPFYLIGCFKIFHFNTSMEFKIFFPKNTFNSINIRIFFNFIHISP